VEGWPRLPRQMVFKGEHCPLDVNLHKLDAPCQPHAHDFLEIAVIFGGEGVHRTIRGDLPVSRGDAFILWPQSWHAFLDCRGLEVYNCCVGPELLRRELAWLREDPVAGFIFGDDSHVEAEIVHVKLTEDDAEIARGHFEALLGLSEDSAFHRVERLGHLLLLLGLLARRFVAEAIAGRARQHPAVSRVVQLLRAEADRDWTLRELAGEVALEPSYLVRLCKAQLGLPPMAYLARLRLERAAHLLLRTDLSITQIAAEVGWPDPNYFCRRFRAYFGLPPTLYRKQLAGGGADRGPHP